MDSKEYKRYAPIILRYSMVLVFLWFGLNQIFNPLPYTGYLPEVVKLLPLEPFMIVKLNGVFETFFAILLAVGVFTRLSAFLLGVHLFGIAFTLGFTDMGVRDFGLAFATLVIAVNGPDIWSMDKHIQNKG